MTPRGLAAAQTGRHHLLGCPGSYLLACAVLLVGFTLALSGVGQQVILPLRLPSREALQNECVEQGTAAGLVAGGSGPVVAPVALAPRPPTTCLLPDRPGQVLLSGRRGPTEAGSANNRPRTDLRHLRCVLGVGRHATLGTGTPSDELGWAAGASGRVQRAESPHVPARSSLQT